MRSGTLRHRVTIQSEDSTQDSLGQPIESWSTDATAWASIRPLQGRELEYAQATHADVSHKIVVRYVAGVTPESRIVFESRIFNILSVIDTEERNRQLEIMAMENV